MGDFEQKVIARCRRSAKRPNVIDLNTISGAQRYSSRTTCFYTVLASHHADKISHASSLAIEGSLLHAATGMG
jgi:hypothetical protein